MSEAANNISDRPRLVPAAPEPAPALSLVPRDGEALAHRGDMAADWDAMGQLQLDYLIAAGLKPEHKLLDLGCGPLRAGVKIIPYLAPSNYFGIDSDKPSLNAGHEKELGRLGLQERCPRPNLFCSAQFKHERLPPGTIDFGLCVSVMRELPLNYLRILLENAAPYFRPGGVLHFSYFELAAAKPFAQGYTNMARHKSFGFKPPYHYYRRDVEAAAAGTSWRCTYYGNWEHPDGESMMIFRNEKPGRGR
jgi:SAM-dependent methyltransferase